MLSIIALLVVGCGAGQNLVGQDKLIAAFKAHSPGPAIDRVMLYDHHAKKMESYDVPEFARASEARLFQKGARGRLEVLLKATPPQGLTGWLSVEAHFEAKHDSDGSPILLYFAGSTALPSAPYLKPNAGYGVTRFGSRLNGVSGSLEGRTVVIDFESSLIAHRDLFAVLVRYLPEKFGQKGLAGGFNAAVTDVLRHEYKTSMHIPSLPIPAR